jgi:predicted RNase H-like HicB family nuclease
MVKTLTYSLTVEHHPDDAGYLAYFPHLPGCQTWGATFEQAVRNAQEALAVYLETLSANGDPLPEAGLTESPISLGVLVRTDLVNS